MKPPAFSQDTVSVGIIGAGFIAQVAHLPAFARTNCCRLFGISDNRQDLLSAVADRFNIGTRVSDYRELLANPAIDAVVVSMPRRAQSAIVRKVLESGRPVLTEKPMAYTAAVASQLAGLAQARGVSLAVGYMRRYDRGVALFRQLLGEAIREGSMGALLHLRMCDFCGTYTGRIPDHLRSAVKRPFRYEEDPIAPEFLPTHLHTAYDYTVNIASHDINLLRYLIRDAVSPVSFRVSRNQAQHAVFATSKTDVDLSVAPARTGRWEQRTDAYFSRGRLSLILDSALAFESAGKVVRQTASGEEILEPAGIGGAFARQAASFLEGIRCGASHATNGREAASDVALIEAMWHIASIA